MIHLKNALITSICLCKRGKNKLRTIYKSASNGEKGELEIQTLMKANLEQGELLNVVYAPERPDSDGEGMSAVEIRKAAHLAAQRGLTLDIEHDGVPIPKEDAWIAETFIVSKGDERFQDWKDYKGNSVGDLTGSWASLIRLESPKLRKAYRDGEFDGVSMFGLAAVETSKSNKAAEKVVRQLEDATKDINMNPEELKALLKAHSDELLLKVEEKIAVISKSVKKTEEPEVIEVIESTRPVFKGKVGDSEAIAAYRDELASWQLNERISKGEVTVEELDAMVKEAEVGEPTDEQANIAKSDNAEVRSLKRQVFKAQQVSNVESKEGEADESNEASSAKDLVAFGQGIAKSVSRIAPSFRTVSKTD
jgi:hypothetical protein